MNTRAAWLLAATILLLGTTPAQSTTLTRWTLAGAAGALSGPTTRLDLVLGEVPCGYAAGPSNRVWLGFWFPEPGSQAAAPEPSTRESRLQLQAYYVGAEAIAHIELPRAAPVTLRMFDVQGRLARELMTGVLSAGPHEVRLYGLAPRPVAGFYFLKLTIGDVSRVARVIVR